MKRIAKGIVTLLLTTSLSSVVSADKCYALALGSGHQSAAYQAGVLSGLAKYLPADQIAYDTITAVSGASVNGVFLAAHPEGQEAQAAERMKQFWLDAGKTTLFDDWYGGLVEGLTLEGGLFDSSPLKEFLSDQLQGVKVQRDLKVGIVNVLSGEFMDFTKENFNTEDNMDHAVFASFSWPGLFAPAHAFGSRWFDGSAVYDIDLFSAINKCLAKGYKQDDIVVDVIMSSASNLSKIQGQNLKSIGMLLRYLEVSSFYGSMDGVLRAKFAFPQINFRYAIAPSKPLPWEYLPLNLNESQVQEIIDIGEQDAKNAVEQGHGISFDHLIHYHTLKKTGDERLMKMNLGEFLQAKVAGTFEDYDVTTDPTFIKY